MATRKKFQLRSALANAKQIIRTPEERAAIEAEDREARRRGRYYKGVARRIRHGLLSQEEQQMLRDDKRRVTAMREQLDA